MIALALIVAAIHALLTREPPAPLPLPPGAFQPTTEQLKQLSIAPVETGEKAELVRASGFIAADGNHSTPIVLPFSGQVTAVLVEPGQHVTAGQPLLRIASPEIVDAANALTSADAQRSAAAEALRIAQANAARQKAIYETAGGALKDYMQAQSDLVAAQSALRAANSAASAANGHLAIFGSPRTASHSDGKRAGVPVNAYRAPVSGTIADRNVAPGQFIAAGSPPMMTITDPSHVWLVAQLPESEVPSVHLGDHVTVTTPALPGKTYQATIDNIGAALDPTTHTLAVRATVANGDGLLKPQMFASFAIERQLSGKGGVFVPAAAVIYEGESARVWVLGARGLLYGRTVATGDTENGFTRIISGLRPGDRVVTGGALFVNEAGLEQ